MTVQPIFVTSNRNFAYTRVYGAANPTTSDTIALNVVCDMDAGDTATVTAVVANGAGNTASVVGGGNTFFSGALIC